MVDHPYDDNAVQLSGRLMAMEVVMTMILRSIDGGHLLAAEAGKVMTRLREESMKTTPNDVKLHARATFNVADEQVAKFVAESTPR